MLGLIEGDGDGERVVRCWRLQGQSLYGGGV